MVVFPHFRMLLSAITHPPARPPPSPGAHHPPARPRRPAPVPPGRWPAAWEGARAGNDQGNPSQMAQPTATEQYFLELVNRARANPAGEAARFGIGLNDGL